MYTPMIPNALNLLEMPWAADTGCFSTPSKYTDTMYLDFLSRNQYATLTCCFATAPDVVANARATWALAKPMLPRIRSLGYPAALVAQDGIELMDIQWDTFDALFIGGTTRWKLSEHAYALSTEAKERGKWIHMGRVNSWKRLKAAWIHGYDSADGTILRFGPDKNEGRLVAWAKKMHQQPRLAAPVEELNDY